MQTDKKRPTTHNEPEAVRRKLAEAFRKRSANSRYTEAERREFARMADGWQKTLPKK